MKKFLILLISLMLPFAAQAVLVSDRVPEGNGKLATVRHVFEGEVPPAVLEVLNAHGYQDATCVYGLSQERLILEVPTGQEGLSRSSDALLVMEKDGARSVVGVRWNPFTNESWLADYGPMGLDLSSVSMTFFQQGLPTRMDYVLTAGEKDWHLDVTGENLWYIRRFGEVQWDEKAGCFELEEGRYPACWTSCLEYLDSFADFPSSVEEAKALVSTSWMGMDLPYLAWLGGNLRAEPTGQSESYGNCYPGVLGEVLAQRMGASAPWYQVRVGDIAGWMSDPYVVPVTDWAAMAETRHRDLPVARTKEDTLLMARPGHGEKVGVLPSDTLLQVLSRREDGWLYVCRPADVMKRWMDLHGTFGFLHETSVDMAASVKTLP